jgi:hypothetical protein
MPRAIRAALPVLFGALLANAPAMASIYDYPIDLNKDLNGLKLTVNPANGPLAKVTVVNGDTQPVACRAEFNSGLQTPVVRVAPIKPGKRAMLTYSVPRDITRLKVNLTCKPRASKENAKENAKESKEK